MLSRLSLRTALQPRTKLLFVAYSNSDASTTAAVVDTKTEYVQGKVSLKPVLQPATYVPPEMVPKPLPFNGPERDLVNFPGLKRLENVAPCRHFFIPEPWFKFFYEKTGVTGPYVFALGTFFMLINKELYFVHNDAHWKHTIVIYFWLYVIIRLGYAKDIKEYLYVENDVKAQEENLKEFDEKNVAYRKEAIELEKKEQWRMEGKQLLFDAKKENVGLQLEATHRQNLMKVYSEVKRRLDYQVELAKIDSRITQKYMVDWVIQKVKESITPEQERESLKKCIADLNLLAAKA